MTTVAPNARSLRAQLAHLESGGLVVLARLQPELEYLFRHALVQNAAYASLVKADRRMLHQAAGEALERLAPGGAPAPDALPILAYHFAESGDHARALHYAELAGQAAAAGYANAEAIHHFGRALELARAAPAAPDQICALYLQRGRAYELSAQDTAALANYADLEAWAAAGGHRRALLEALNARATIYVRPSAASNQTLGRALAEGHRPVLALGAPHPERVGRQLHPGAPQGVMPRPHRHEQGEGAAEDRGDGHDVEALV